MSKPNPAPEFTGAHRFDWNACHGENPQRHQFAGAVHSLPVAFELCPLNVRKPLGAKQTADRSNKARWAPGFRAGKGPIRIVELHERNRQKS
jgi:hypothetical protein